MVDLRVDNAEMLRNLPVGEHFLNEEGKEMIVTENSENIFASISAY